MSIHCRTNPAEGEEEEGTVLSTHLLPRRTPQLPHCCPVSGPHAQADGGSAGAPAGQLVMDCGTYSPQDALRGCRLRGSLGPQAWAGQASPGTCLDADSCPLPLPDTVSTETEATLGHWPKSLRNLGSQPVSTCQSQAAS